LCGIVSNLLFLKRYQAIQTVVYKVFRLELSWIYLKGLTGVITRPYQLEDKPEFGIPDETDDSLRLVGDMLSQQTQNFTRKIWHES